MNKIVLGVEYDGSHYRGWQRQQNVKSIQSCLECAISKVANSPIQVCSASRTDAGVHAMSQVVHFETSVIRKDSAWTMGVNRYLPIDIAVRWSRFVEPNFHVRFDAISRRYRYIIFNHSNRPAILSKGVAHCNTLLDSERMHIASQELVGEHDFTSFRGIHCQSRSPFRKIQHIYVTRYGNYIVIDIKANSFLHHMVRNIVGTLLVIGRGEKDVNWIKEVLRMKNRAKAAPMAKPEGLYLVSVDYPLKYKLPKTDLGPFFFQTNKFNFTLQ